MFSLQHAHAPVVLKKKLGWESLNSDGKNNITFMNPKETFLSTTETIAFIFRIISGILGGPQLRCRTTHNMNKSE